MDDGRRTARTPLLVGLALAMFGAALVAMKVFQDLLIREFREVWAWWAVAVSAAITSGLVLGSVLRSGRSSDAFRYLAIALLAASMILLLLLPVGLIGRERFGLGIAPVTSTPTVQLGVALIAGLASTIISRRDADEPTADKLGPQEEA